MKYCVYFMLYFNTFEYLHHPEICLEFPGFWRKFPCFSKIDLLDCIHVIENFRALS